MRMTTQPSPTDAAHKPRDHRIFDFTRFRADRRKLCEAIVAYLDGRTADAVEIANAVGMARTNIVQRYLKPMAEVGLVRCVDPGARGGGATSSTWTKGNGKPAPTTPLARDAANQAKILAWLDEHDAPATYAEIAEGVGLSEDIVRRNMRAMAIGDKVFRVGTVTDGHRRAGVGRALWLPGPPPEGWTAP